MTRALSWRVALALAAVAMVTVLLYRPALDLQITGDDYQMAQFAHDTLCHPHLLVAPLGQFFRPLTNWSFILDRLLWGTDPWGYHATTLVLEVLAAMGLLAAAMRLGLSVSTAGVVAVLWVCSPYASEAAVWAAIRHQNLLVIFWMLLIVVWPQQAHGERWTRPRLAAAAALVVALALTKETWVVTPALVLFIALAANGWSWRGAFKPALLLSVPAVVYTLVRFMAIPTTGGYFEIGWHAILKIPHMLAAFLWLQELPPVGFPLKWTGAVAVLAVTGLIVAGWRARNRAAVVGAALLLVPLVPTLLVPLFPLHYAAVPYAGFLLLVCGAGQVARELLPDRFLRTAGLAAVLLALLVGAAGAAVVRADLSDWERVSDAHARLLAEARLVAGTLPSGELVAVVRREHGNPLKVIADHPRGLFKLWFVRGQDPYGLIDAGALFDWVLQRPGMIVRRLELGELEPGRPGRVLLHRSGGFQWVPGTVRNLSQTVRGWRRLGVPVRVIEVEPCRP